MSSVSVPFAVRNAVPIHSFSHPRETGREASARRFRLPCVFALPLALARDKDKRAVFELVYPRPDGPDDSALSHNPSHGPQAILRGVGAAADRTRPLIIVAKRPRWVTPARTPISGTGVEVWERCRLVVCARWCGARHPQEASDVLKEQHCWRAVDFIIRNTGARSKAILRQTWCPPTNCCES